MEDAEEATIDDAEIKKKIQRREQGTMATRSCEALIPYQG